ncbi:MAG TPA: helix-turn-helix domain-containing protein [Bryobacteraceae bacterium]|nr:helix-turn-helix domain-containing protein [Bryobacteraceae bacterium]
MNEKFEGIAQQLLSGNVYLEEAIELLERSMIQRAMESTEGNRSEASKQLGIHRNTLQKKLIEYGIANGHSRIRRPAARQQSRSRRGKASA